MTWHVSLDENAFVAGMCLPSPLAARLGLGVDAEKRRHGRAFHRRVHSTPASLRYWGCIVQGGVGGREKAESSSLVVHSSEPLRRSTPGRLWIGWGVGWDTFATAYSSPVDACTVSLRDDVPSRPPRLLRRSLPPETSGARLLSRRLRKWRRAWSSSDTSLRDFSTSARRSDDG